MTHWTNLLAERISGSLKINMGCLCTCYIWSGMCTYSANAPTNQEMIGKLFSTFSLQRTDSVCLILSKGLLWQLPYNPWTKCFRWLVTSSEHQVQSHSQGQENTLRLGICVTVTRDDAGKLKQGQWHLNVFVCVVGVEEGASSQQQGHWRTGDSEETPPLWYLSLLQVALWINTEIYCCKLTNIRPIRRIWLL